MSHIVNDDILERAYEMSEECTNSMLGDQLDNALNEKPQDLERIQNLTEACERHLQFTETLNDEEEVYGSESMQVRADEIRDAMREDGISA